jgi:hypothetical protein
LSFPARFHTAIWAMDRFAMVISNLRTTIICVEHTTYA